MTNRIDLVGQRFGKLIVISFSHMDKNRQSAWLCRCDCGNEKIILSGNFKSGKTRSCGCLQKEKTIKASRLDLSNKRFGKLIVLEYHSTKGTTAVWKCKCDCGNEIITSRSNLMSGHTKSCGCIQFKGEEISYNGLHKWLNKNYPKNNICNHCGKKSKTDYANISGKYKRDIKDFIELCRKCHIEYDNGG